MSMSALSFQILKNLCFLLIRFNISLDNHFFFVDFDYGTPILLGAIVFRILSNKIEHFSKFQLALFCWYMGLPSSDAIFVVKISSSMFSSIPINNCVLLFFIQFPVTERNLCKMITSKQLLDNGCIKNFGVLWLNIDQPVFHDFQLSNLEYFHILIKSIVERKFCR